MKYYSDVTRSFYDSEKACLEAEFKIKEEQNREKIRRERELALEKEKKKKLAAERKARAAEVEEARKAMTAAQSKYKEVVEAFVRDYGSYHYTSTSADDMPSTLFDIFNLFKF